MNLKEYEREKFAIADIIRSAQAVDTEDRDFEHPAKTRNYKIYEQTNS